MDVYSRTSLSAGDIFREAFALIQRNLVLCGVGALLMFALKTGADLGVRQWVLPESRWIALFRLIYLPFLGVVHYFVLTRLMQNEGMTDHGWSPGRLLRYIAAYLLATLGMILGMILLVVPGVIAAIRWTIYANFIIGRDLAPVSAIKASWEATRGYGGTIFVTMLVLGLATVIGIFLTRGGFGTLAEITTTSVIAGNISTAALAMVGLCMTTAIYTLLVGADHARYGEIFG